MLRKIVTIAPLHTDNCSRATNIAAMNMKESNQAYIKFRVTFTQRILQINTLKFISHSHVLSKIDINGY